MQNIDVQFNATSNFASVKADLAALRAQAAALGDVFKQNAYAKAPASVDPERWKAGTRAVHEASNAYRQAASSSGLFNTQQIRATSEAERYTKQLQKQKMALGDMMKHRGIMREVYRDQLRYQRMSAQYWGTDTAGKGITDIAVPRSVPRDLDTMRQRLGMVSVMAKAAGGHFIDMGKNIQWAGRQLSVGFTYPVALFGAAAGVMAFKVEDSFAKIAKVYDVSAQALTNEAMRTKELAELKTESMKNATKVAKEYGMTVEKTLAVEQALAATGLKGKDLMQSTEEIQRISALGDIDPTQTTELFVSLRTAFKDTIKPGQEVTDAFNLMNAASNASSLSLQDFAEAVPRLAGAFAQTGGTIEQLTTLMTAAREQGVDPIEAANAFKSLTARMTSSQLRNKATGIYQGAGIDIDINEIYKEAEGNLYKFMELLGKARNQYKDLLSEGTTQTEAAAALFGAYQLNRGTAAVVNIGDAMAGVENQTKAVLDLQEKSSAELAHIAELSKKAMMDNPAGKFKQEWAKFQIELSKMGEPFLEAANSILGVFTAIGKAINGLSDGKKNMLMIAAIMLALVGPAIMLTGLFMNLFGQFIKGAGSIGAFLTRFKLVTKEEQAAALTTEAVNTAMKKQVLTTASLAQEVQVLTAAYQRATVAAKTFAVTQGAATAGAMGNAAQVKPGQKGFIGPQLPSMTGKGIDGRYTMTAAEARAFQNTSYNNGGGGRRTNADRLAEARKVVAEEQKVARIAGQRQQIETRTAAAINNGGVSLAASSAAMGVMMFSSNETANNIAKLVLVGTLIVPAVKTFALWAAAGAKSAWSTAAGYRAAAAAQAGGIGKFGAAKAGAKGIGMGVMGMMGGPWGVALTAVAAIGFGIYKWKQHLDEVKAKQEALNQAQKQGQADVLKSTQKWAAATGQAYENYVRYNDEGKKDVENKEKMKYDDLVREYSSQTSSATVDGQTKKVNTAEQFPDMSAGEQNWALAFKASELIFNMNMEVEDAKTNLMAFLDAAGYGTQQAELLATRALNTVGNGAEDIDWSDMVDRGFKTMQDASENPALQKQILNNIGSMFSQALIGEENPEDQRAFVNGISTRFMSYWDAARGDLNALFKDAGGLEAFFNSSMTLTEEDKKRAIEIFKPLLNDSQALSKITVEDFKGLEEGLNLLELSGGQTATDFKKIDEFKDSLKGLAENEENFFGWAQDNFGLPDDVDSWLEFVDTLQYKLIGLDKTARTNMLLGDGAADYKTKGVGDFGMLEALRDPKGFKAAQEKGFMLEGTKNTISEVIAEWKNFDTLTDETAAMLTEFFNNGVGIDTSKLSDEQLKILKEISEALDMPLNGITAAEGEVDQLGRKIDQLPNFKKIEITVDQVGGVLRTAMSATQEDMATSAMNKFNSAWDSRIAAASAANNRASQAFDNRWQARKEGLENAYDKRIKAVQNLIDAEQKADRERQRLYENEKTRLERLAELENSNIDFNQAINEGRLDDAAKIGNDQVAKTAIQAMDDEQAKAELASEARQEALEKKIEALEKRKDRAMKGAEKAEQRMRQHMENAQQSQIAGMEKVRAAEEANLNQRLELFKAFTPRTQKELEWWMKQTGLSYDVFGKDIKAKGKGWSEYFQTALQDHIRLAGTQVKNDTYWASVGKGMGEKLVQGIGFRDMAQFQHFVRTGQMGKGANTLHEGGVVGSARGSRKGVAPTYKGLHRSEEMIRAQKGEYVINKNASAQHAGILDAINSGNFHGIMGGESGGYGGPAALMGAGMAHLLKAGLANTFANAKTNANTQTAGSFAGMAGSYGGSKWSAEQMRNAAIIASVGAGMGMSKRDLQIGIMTSIAESNLKNIAYGDRDSVGLFQQRTSQGWGTVEQIMNPRYAAGKFFSSLKGHTERGEESPWLAAQHVQRSAFADGSNYAKWWGAAQAIFSQGIKKGKKGYSSNGAMSGAGGGFVAGGGGRHKPINAPTSRRLHGSPPAYDFPAPVGTPLFAVSNGVVTGSYDIPGYEPRAAHGGLGYKSYGRVVTMRTDGGANVLYAHLSRRSVRSGQRVAGGSTIGYSGNTGNSSGPHLHFGASNGPSAWLRTGGEIRYDNTPVVAHRGETMLSSSLTRKFKDNIKSGGNDAPFHVTLDLRGATIREDVDIKKAVNAAIDERESRTGRNRKVN